MKAFEQLFEQPEDEEDHIDWLLRKQGWRAALEWVLNNSQCRLSGLEREIEEELES